MSKQNIKSNLMKGLMHWVVSEQPFLGHSEKMRLREFSQNVDYIFISVCRYIFN